MRRLPPLFDGLNDVDVHAALRRFKERDAGVAEPLFRAGDAADGVIVLQFGRLHIYHDDQVVGHVLPGEIVGEMALFETGDRTATVVASEPSKMLVLARPDYEALRDVLHPVAMAIEKAALAVQVARMRRVVDRVSALSEGSLIRRPNASFFSSVASLFGRGGLFSTGTVEPIDTLEKSPLFADAPSEALSQIAKFITPEVYAPGHVLVTQGEPGDTLYIVDEGQVDVLVSTSGDKALEVGKLGPGDVLGVAALAEGLPRTASCVAATRVLVQRMDRPGWESLVNEPYITGSAFRRAMIRTVSEQLRQSNRLLAKARIERSPMPALRTRTGA